MAFHAWTQDVPIDLEAYRDITGRMGAAEMPGLVVHLAIEQEDGRMSYIDVWRSEQECDAAFETVVHPAVGAVLRERGVVVDGEPPRRPLRVVDVRFADGPALVP
jgi:hypothetical protein